MKTLLIIISSAAVFTLTQNSKALQPEKKIRTEIRDTCSDLVWKADRTTWMKDKMK